MRQKAAQAMGHDYSRAHPMHLDTDIAAVAGGLVQLSSPILDEVHGANLFGRTLQAKSVETTHPL